MASERIDVVVVVVGVVVVVVVVDVVVVVVVDVVVVVVVGQSGALQLCDSSRGGQATPPCSASVVTLRQLVCVPPLPQVTLQVPKLPQSEYAQSTGQSC